MMSSSEASSPMSSTSSSPAAAPARRSVKELLAELSDSDDAMPQATADIIADKPISRIVGSDGDFEAEDEVLVGRGKLTARLVSTSEAEPPTTNGEIAEPTASVLNTEVEGTHSPDRQPKKSLFKPGRRLLLKRKRPVEDSDEEAIPLARRRSRGNSPSPTISTASSTPQLSFSPRSSRQGIDVSEAAGKSKFQTLVEKARRERLAREEAEDAKKAARKAQELAPSPRGRRQRGSSPADDSEEDSDDAHVSAAKRLTKDARPTRKASRKALEEMNRETQRMNRNMQLAHQIKTKKKFTKESFLASFTRAAADAVKVHDSTSSSSSIHASDDEGPKIHSTPPTSPLHSPAQDKTTEANTDISNEPAAFTNELDDIPDFNALIASRRAEAVKEEQLRAQSIKSQPTVQVCLDIDSDSEIEIIHDKASKRKYVVFENLPRRKAREQQSHLALRSLAKINPVKDKKSTMAGGEVGPALLRKARQQALEERKAKLEKLKAKGLVIQTVEEREQEEEELEDLVEKARQEDGEIRKREKELAKKDGTYQKDALDEEDSDEDDGDFEDEPEEAGSGTDDGDDAGDEAEVDDEHAQGSDVIDDAASESGDDTESRAESMAELEEGKTEDVTASMDLKTPAPSRVGRASRIVIEDDDDDDEDDSNNGTGISRHSPVLPTLGRKTPQSILRSARKAIPGLQPPSDDLPIGLTQAFAATMADSQTQDYTTPQDRDDLDIDRDVPSPQVNMSPRLNRLESVEIIPESVAGSQAELDEAYLGLNDSLQLYQSPAVTTQMSQTPFVPTQDAGYHFSPFAGDRFAETPGKEPSSTEETILLHYLNDSPVGQRKGRLQQGRKGDDEDEEDDIAPTKSAFKLMDNAAKRRNQAELSKKQSEARQAFDEAAEESDDEYAGLGGASDDESGEENEDDRQMIDEDTQVGRGDGAKLAKLHADRERETDEAAVSKLLKDITTGALRRKRGAGDDLDLSDEEDVNARKREAKRREFARMRRELLKDEAVGKIAEDKKKEAFLRSIEDHEDNAGDEDDFDQPETTPENESQDRSQQQETDGPSIVEGRIVKPASTALKPTCDSRINIGSLNHKRTQVSKKPATLAEIRESVSFLIEEPDSQASMDISLSDSEEEPEAYVNLDRHFQQAEADEDDENEDLGDFVVDDSRKETITDPFKKPDLPARAGDRAPFSERRTKAPVIDRLSLKRQASSSSAGSTSKLAFSRTGSIGSVPSLLRRATTNSSLGNISSRDHVSGTGVVTGASNASKTERGSAAQEKEFVRKGANTSRNAINYQGRQNLKEEKMSARAGIVKKQQSKKKGGNFLTGLFKSETWA